MDTSCNSHGELSDANNKQDSVIAYEGKPSLDTCSNAKITTEQTKKNDAIDSDDDTIDSDEGWYLYALLALGQERVGDKSFYAGMKETIPLSNSSGSTSKDSIESQPPSDHIGMDSVTYKEGEDQDMNFKDHDEGAENLISIMEEQEKLTKEVLALGSAFVEDVQERMKTMDTQYLTGLRRFFTVYMDTIRNTEPASSATPKLALIFLHSLQWLK